MADISEALVILSENGFKKTNNRVKMLEVLAESNRYLSAREVKDLMEESTPNISFDTIYRNLGTYTDLDILEETELDGERMYRYHCQPGHHHHFICTSCGRSKEINACPMENYVNELDGFTIQDHRFEIFGLCDKCSQGTPS